MQTCCEKASTATQSVAPSKDDGLGGNRGRTKQNGKLVQESDR